MVKEERKACQVCGSEAIDFGFKPILCGQCHREKIDILIKIEELKKQLKRYEP